MDLQDLINTGKCIFGGLMERGMEATKQALPLSRDLIDSYNRLARDMPLPLPRIDPNILEAFYSAPEESYFKSGCGDRAPRPFAPPAPKPTPKSTPPKEHKPKSEQIEMKMDTPSSSKAPKKATKKAAKSDETAKKSEKKAAKPPKKAALSFEELKAKKKKELQEMADEFGCAYKPKDTKAMLAQMILEASKD